MFELYPGIYLQGKSTDGFQVSECSRTVQVMGHTRQAMVLLLSNNDVMRAKVYMAESSGAIYDPSMFNPLFITGCCESEP